MAWPPAQLLEVWEQGAVLRPIRRLALLSGVATQSSEVAASHPITLADAHRTLLNFYPALLGLRMDAVVNCPDCSATLEFEITGSMLHELVKTQQDEFQTIEFSLDEFVIRARPARMDDLLAAGQLTDLAAARALLIERCVMQATARGTDVAPRDLPLAMIWAIAAELSRSDPAADLSIQLSCPDCGHAWDERLDLGAYLWTQIEASAVRLLREVSALARAYGWREADILAMTAWRRTAFLRLVDDAA